MKFQSHHSNKMQATIHPFVVYLFQGTDVHHLFYVAISNCLTHNTVAVHLFQVKLIAHIESRIGAHPSKIYYFSDGSAAQYKNCKKIANISFHSADFGVDAEWRFFAMSHGKGPCDGVGCKRLS